MPSESESPLTPSGAGVLVEATIAPGPEDLRPLLDAHRFVVLRGALPTQADALALLRGFGPINEAETRKDGAVVVEASEVDEVFRSNHALPLHKDGLLTGFDVAYVGIYCVAFEDVEGGRTYVSDANRALARMPDEDVEALRRHGVEGLAVDASGYYREEHTQTWHRVPAFVARPGREPTLHLGLPHAPGEPESWRVRVAEVEADTSERILAALRRALLDPDFTYHHDWRVGDLLLMDNYAVLHGRESFRATDRRLANIQVLAR